MSGAKNIHPHEFVMQKAAVAAVDAVAPSKVPSLLKRAGKAIGITRDYTPQEQMARIAATVAHNTGRPVICDERNQVPEHAQKGIISVQVEVAPGRHQVLQVRNGKIV